MNGVLALSKDVHAFVERKERSVCRRHGWIGSAWAAQVHLGTTGPPGVNGVTVEGSNVFRLAEKKSNFSNIICDDVTNCQYGLCFHQ